jgi:transposase-like protein
LDKERCVYLYWDGFGVKVRVGLWVVRCTILLAIGVREDGEKVFLGMEMMSGEKKEAWRHFLDNYGKSGFKEGKISDN